LVDSVFSPSPPFAGAESLLLAKLLPPLPRAGAVPRARLTAQLEGADAQRLTLVAAPPGFGKTTAVADWLASAGRACAWVSLDADDSDELRFWRYLAAALDRLWPGVGASATTLLASAAALPGGVAVMTLLNELRRVAPAGLGDRPAVLVLDDYHQIEAPAVHEQLARFLERMPPGLRVVLVSRADPPLPLSRLRAHNDLLELRADELRLTAVEVEAFLRTTMGLELSAPQVAALAGRTEGWIAALQLAALALRTADVAPFIAGFTGTHRYIVDYLVEEVLSRLPPERQTFLLETAVLDRLSAGLCEAVTGHPGAQALLEWMEQAQLFLLPLDQERRWFRFHGLFHDLLRFRLQQSAPGRATDLHARAASWFVARGMLPEAIRHALAAGAVERAADWIAEVAEGALRRGEIGVLLGWLLALPAPLLQSRPRLCLAYAWCLLYSGRLAEVGPALTWAEWGLEAAESDTLVEVTALRAHLARLSGNLPLARVLSEQALAAATPEQFMLRGFVTLNIAGVARLSGDLAAAERFYAEAAALHQRGGNAYLAAVARCHQGDVQAQRGALRAAADTYAEIVRAGFTPGATPLPAGQAAAGLALVRYAWDELDEAERLLDLALEQGRQNDEIDMLLAAHLGRAQLCGARADRDGVREALGQLDDLAQRSGHPQLLTLARSARIRSGLLWPDCDLAAALSWAQGYEITARPLTGPETMAQLTAARVCLVAAADDPTIVAAALARLTALRERAARQGHGAAAAEALLLEALAHAGLGSTGLALTALNEALRLGEEQGQVRLFVDLGPGLRPRLLALLARAHPQGAPRRDYLERVRRAVGGVPARRPLHGPTPQLIEPLSPREREVLALIAAGLSNEAIAGELVVTVATVKKHATGIFGKLGVASRTEAVARARALALLP